MNHRINIIAAIDEKRGLGKDNDLLFRIHEDMLRLRELTKGHPLVMGRKTFESLGRLLPNRTHIVITRDPKSLESLAYQPHVIVSSLEEGLEEAKKAPGSDEIFVFGGGQIFTEAVEKQLVDRLYLTIAHKTFDADTFFPDYSAYSKVIEEKDGEENGLKYSFVTLEK